MESKSKKPGKNEKPQIAPKIALCGTRGIPACYGGFETFAEEIAPRLQNMGFELIVYGRKHFINYTEKRYRGVEIRLLAAPRQKYLETPVHSLYSFIDIVLRRRVDLVLLCNAANSPFAWVLRLFGIPVLVNVDGIERKRAKWNALGRLWYRLGEVCSVLFGSKIIADAEVIKEYYAKTYNAQSVVIRYGYNASHEGLSEKKVEAGLSDGDFSELESSILKELQLSPNRYLLYVSRLEPENNAHVVIEAYKSLPPESKKYPLVIVGDAPYAREYIASLKSQAAGENIIFTGYRFGNDYITLQLGAYLYIQATEVGGTHPALVEAMGFGNCVVVNGTPENVEVIKDAGLSFSHNHVAELSSVLTQLLRDAFLVRSFQKKAFMRARTEFSWGKVAEDYKELIFHTLQK